MQRLRDPFNMAQRKKPANPAPHWAEGRSEQTIALVQDLHERTNAPQRYICGYLDCLDRQGVNYFAPKFDLAEHIKNTFENGHNPAMKIVA